MSTSRHASPYRLSPKLVASYFMNLVGYGCSPLSNELHMVNLRMHINVVVHEIK
jgi:hypothetical protein